MHSSFLSSFFPGGPCGHNVSIRVRVCVSPHLRAPLRLLTSLPRTWVYAYKQIQYFHILFKVSLYCSNYFQFPTSVLWGQSNVAQYCVPLALLSFGTFSTVYSVCIYIARILCWNPKKYSPSALIKVVVISLLWHVWLNEDIGWMNRGVIEWPTLTLALPTKYVVIFERLMWIW